MIGQILGHYRITGQIGAGGMGVVYQAHDERLHRDVALKVLPAGQLASDAARKRFRTEALALSKLNHPNIATVHDFDTQDEIDFVVMEYITGTTLSDRLKDGALPEKEVAAFGLQIAAALEAAHEQGIIHRDFKPSNIMVTPKGQVKVLDFGLARVTLPGIDPNMTASMAEPAAAGTLPYMSPEQLLGENADARSDIWAAGAVLYEMSTGQRPFPETQVPRLIDEILNRAPRHPRELNPRISPGLESIILKALDKEPAHRYQSAKELLVDQERLSISLPLLVARPKRHTRRNAILLASIALVVLFGGWFGLRTWRARTEVVSRKTILIGEFDNRTSEAVFDQTLAELLAISLEQSHRLSVFPHSRLPDVLQRMEKPADSRIDERVGLEICQREDLQALLIGSISKIGDGYIVVARALSPEGKALVSSQQTAASANQVPAALDTVAQELRNGLGESLSTVNASSLSLAKVTSPSLEAISFYTLGKRRLASSDPQGAILFFQKALERDPQFAMAHDYLGVAYTNLYDSERAEQQMHAASLLADHVTESEKAKILGDYNLIIGNFDEACGHFQVLTQLQPQNPSAYMNLGLCYAGKFDFAAAYSEMEKGMRLQPDSSSVRSNLSMFSFLKGDTAKSLVLAKEVLRDHPADFEGLSNLGRGYLLNGDLAQARQTFEKMVKAGGDTEAEGRASLADLALATGQYREARSQLEAGIVIAESRGNKFSGVKDRLTLAGLSLAEGGLQKFQQEISQIETRAADPAHLLLLGILSARGHRSDEGQKILRKLQGLAGENQAPRLRSFQYLLQAELQLSQGNAQAAVEAAKTAVQYEKSTFALETLARAEAAAGKNEDAIATYEQVLARANERAFSYDAPGFHHVVDIHYRLGILYQKIGQIERAKNHLETFLKYWPHPDGQMEIYKDAVQQLRSLAASS